jgi:hypothetical protein
MTKPCGQDTGPKPLEQKQQGARHHGRRLFAKRHVCKSKESQTRLEQDLEKIPGVFSKGCRLQTWPSSMCGEGRGGHSALVYPSW